jgi:superfamily II DNA or RNA helicase
MPNGTYYHSPLGIWDFQIDAVIDTINHGERIGIVDTGLGKTHITMCLAGLLYDENAIDLVIHVGRKAKAVDRDEFPKDWADFTSLKTLVYHGTTRDKRLARDGIPDVLLTTYETLAAGVMRRFKKDSTKSGKGSRRDGPLFEALGLRDKRILWVFDEVDWLRGRTAERHQAVYYVLNQLRKGPHRQITLGLTATVISTEDEGAFNIARLITPKTMRLGVVEYENYFTRGRDEYHQYVYRRDRQPEFDALFQRCIFRKSADDPDIARQLPKVLYRNRYIDMDPAHRALYEAVGELYGPEKAELTQAQQTELSLALKLTAGHPAAHLHADNKLSKAIVKTLGEDGLRAVPSSKSRWLIEELKMLVHGQGAQVIVFTWFAKTVLPEVAADLRAAGFEIGIYDGEHEQQNREAKAAFKAGKIRVLLSSDAGARGLNLPEARYVIEYEPAAAADIRQQRFGRHQRLVGGDRTVPVYAWTMAIRKTIEVGSLSTVMGRMKRQADLYGDDKVATTPERH